MYLLCHLIVLCPRLPYSQYVVFSQTVYTDSLAECVCPFFLTYGVNSLVFPCGSAGKEAACNVGNLGSIPGLGRSPGGGNGYPLQYSCLEGSMGRGACQASVHGVANSLTSLPQFFPTTLLLNTLFKQNYILNKGLTLFFGFSHSQVLSSSHHDIWSEVHGC